MIRNPIDGVQTGTGMSCLARYSDNMKVMAIVLLKKCIIR